MVLLGRNSLLISSIHQQSDESSAFADHHEHGSFGVSHNCRSNYQMGANNEANTGMQITRVSPYDLKNVINKVTWETCWFSEKR